MRLLSICMIIGLIVTGCVHGDSNDESGLEETMVTLPSAATSGGMSVEEAIQRRRSVRSYSSEEMSLSDLGQLVWAAQGITSDRGLRSAPSAGATYPLELYVVAGNVENLEAGLYRYHPKTHSLTLVNSEDIRDALSRAALGQQWVQDAPVNLVFSGVLQRTASRYGERALRYVHMEVGHAAENVFLQAVSLGMGSVMIGAFRDDEVKKLIGMEAGEEPYAIIPVGR
jgi:SagB-type dehydrogenase family enzyme